MPKSCPPNGDTFFALHCTPFTGEVLPYVLIGLAAAMVYFVGCPFCLLKKKKS